MFSETLDMGDIAATLDLFADDCYWRNMYKPVAQQNLWLQGGNLALSRFFSKFVALQIKARMEGIDTPVYRTPLLSTRSS